MAAGIAARCRSALVIGLLCASGVVAADLPEVIERVKPSVVVVGTYQLTRSPKFVMRGTGFVVADGLQVATNGHVIAQAASMRRRASGWLS
jgi:serine protease Do